ncbi:unnamed protein product [Peronospora destructor]|uniref:C2 domain-containing protein n=1 Tax=Peronospora destructor TaxID=86335 RepID=A0AAV0VFJ3_9STRA|nr:unnamed protein product [Peronospora destructor]
MSRRAKRQQEQAATPTPPTADPSSESSLESEVTPEIAAPVADDPVASAKPNPASSPKPTPKQPSPKKHFKATSQSTTETFEIMNSTIHVKVLKANNLPTMDFGKRQDPFVLVQLNNSSPKSWATTDPVFNGNTNPEWGKGSNNELELFYDASLHGKEAVLTVEVYSNETGDELIGSGQLDVSSIVQKQSSEPNQATVRLGGNRGEVVVEVWCGPPVRKAFRAAGRATKLLDARDAFVATCCSIVSTICGAVSNYTQMPTDFAKKYRKLSMAVTAMLGIMAAGALTVFLAFAVPTMLVAFFTLPFWIIPFLVTSFFTAPLWVPILLLVGLFLLFIATFIFGLGVTSRPVRRKGAMISNKIKHSDVGKRVVYEKTV